MHGHERLQLTSAKMGIYTHVSRSSTQTLPFTIRNVQFRFGIAVLLCHPKINDMYNVGGLRPRFPNQEIVRLDVPIDKVLVVDRLNTGDLERREQMTKEWCREGSCINQHQAQKIHVNIASSALSIF